ncbi:Glycosyl transferase 4-like domain-containing protein [Peptoclostridium litorale DSM 5388]|uniref:Glycosyl transferase n=1 Tax=Peptoclostridium litorale DSM 5388 TaxID=1121324 RepID=A0A069RPU5_PEPLI|nr:glycosyltransferase family 4 protein [Peptoclostridium litorale]KDR96192.1 glycosyl transferase [Peptoclostridium litorale DSM 5388]SIO13289.1 Glycosyl transferase 4-like domain-containing protein [Peptoclostridium litorale DSM 5388]
MKKILHIISQRPKKTGSGIFLSALVENAQEKGYSQAVVSGMVREDIEGWRSDVPLYPVEFESERLPFHVVGMSDVMPYSSTRYSEMDCEMLEKWKIQFEGTLEKAIDEFQPDIIISHHLWILTSMAAKNSRGIPVIGICHGTDLRQLELCPHFRERVIEGCKNLCGVMALNEHQMDKISRIYGIPKSRISVSGCGYDSCVFNFDGRAQTDKRGVDIVYAGKLSFSKGLMQLVDAVDAICAKEDIRLVIAGSGSGHEEKRIRERAAKSAAKIEFAGMLSHSQLAQLFKKSDIFVLPSFYEGLPLVIVEALASGLRVVATDIPGVRGWMGEDINKSTAIEYVKLPRLITDVPHEDDVDLFVQRLKTAIEVQIKNTREYGDSWIESVRDGIHSKSWKSVFEQIELAIEYSL